MVFYGAAKDVVKQQKNWDYIVFDRKNMTINPNKTGYSYYYSVHIICEEFIPEGLEELVINKMQEIKGMRVAGDSGEYDYSFKPGTDTIVEMFTIDFVKAKKV